MLYAKMLKETETKVTSFFCPIFVIGGILIREGLSLGPLPPFP